MYLREYADLAERFEFFEIREGATMRAGIRSEPIGVVAAIPAWNSPVGLVMMKLAPALAAGCTIVVKPAAETPLNGYLLAEVCADVGLPKGVVSILPASGDAGAHLVRHVGVDKVAFTGSTAVGRWIMAECAPQLKRVTLELGGKSAAIMLDDVDTQAAVAQMVPVSLMLSGQGCMLQTRVLVPRTRSTEVVEELCTAVSKLKVGDPNDADTFFGPLISERQRDRVEGYIAAGCDEGAKIALGGGRPPHLPKGWYIEPTIFVGVHNSMRIAREEIFGPVISVIEYDDVNEAIAIANDSEYGLGGAVYTADPGRGFEVAKRVRTGTFGINKYGGDPRIPFGGYKQSGIGREGGVEGLSAYLETKAITLPDGFDPLPAAAAQ
jgi:betaine-aldehyde dehydrogenase